MEDKVTSKFLSLTPNHLCHMERLHSRKWKKTSLRGLCSPSATFPPGNPLKMTSQAFSQVYGSPELVHGINIFCLYTKSSQHKGYTEFVQNQQKKSECNVQVKLSPTCKWHRRPLDFFFSFLPNADENISNLSISLLNKISKICEASLPRKTT